MCWSERASYVSFTVGTLTNAVVCSRLWRDGRHDAIPPLLWWQFCLLMQIPEALEWRDIRQQREERALLKDIAFWLNVLQPVVAYAAVWAVVRSHDAPSLAMLGIYALCRCRVYLGGDTVVKLTRGTRSKPSSSKASFGSKENRDDRKAQSVNARNSPTFYLYHV
jgi:hypothetical protein